MKIQILGYSGSGKSTFAIELSKIYKIKVTHIDKIYFKENWIENPDDVVIDLLKEEINKEDWIIDGNYSRFLGEKRKELSDQIFIFNFNRFRCLFNIIKRRIKYHNKVRPSSADGCIEKIDFAFIKWILKDGRTKRHKQLLKQTKNTYSSKVITFKNHFQVNNYLKSIKRN